MTNAPAIYVKITATRGSTPRAAGTAMAVTATAAAGTIGGGALEHWAIGRAREILDADAGDESVTLALGPRLGQCCGGAVTLHFGKAPAPVDAIQTTARPYVTGGGPPASLWLWGAGHVGRAVVRACPAEAFDITWVDSAPDRFPETVPQHVTVVSAAQMDLLAARSPSDAHHLIFTYSHDIDLALCAALLRLTPASIGLIGSDSKWARFRSKLRAMGLDPTAIACPIGNKALGKHPDQIAQGVVDVLLSRPARKALA
ncbi:MAG: xanthine dehydrogenase accessory protein XdhC [Pseudomonadota bacterium]